MGFGTVYWTMRSWVYDYPITGDYTVWDQEGFDVGNEETWVPARRRNIRRWNFLRPFFASRGYHLYRRNAYLDNDYQSDLFATLLTTPPAARTKAVEYPYALNCLDDDTQAKFTY